MKNGMFEGEPERDFSVISVPFKTIGKLIVQTRKKLN
jgi:hypothetical protein